ncbi:MAG: hypothetical protein ABI596_00740 [Pyrinomonadaceae bacterium]
MNRSLVLLAIALLITTTGPLHSKSLAPLALPQTQTALKSFTPLRIENEGTYSSLTVKVVGPSMKTLKLGPSENQVVMVASGEYYCLYRFKADPSDPFIFKKSGNFQIAGPTTDKPSGYKVVVAAEEDRPSQNLEIQIREVKPSSAKEFNAAIATPASPANNQIVAPTDSTDSLRLQSFNLVIAIGDLFYGETPAEKRQQKNLVSVQLNQYVRAVLLPKLTRQGFKVKNLGIRDDVPETPTEPTLVIDYSEAEGQAFTMYSGYGEPAAHGVEITCSLTLYHPSVITGVGIWDATLVAVNDDSIKMSFFADKEAVLHNQALKYLRQQLNDLILDFSDWSPQLPGRSPTVREGSPTHPRKPRTPQP